MMANVHATRRRRAPKELGGNAPLGIAATTNSLDVRDALCGHVNEIPGHLGAFVCAHVMMFKTASC